jgi:hypothetical protein
MRSAFLVTIGLALAACDKDEARAPDAASVDASIALEAAAPTTTPAIADAAPRAAFDASMPPRPVPTSNPTVSQGMPEAVQLQAIQYMEAMGAPRPDDANADPDYAAQLAQQLGPVMKSFDKGDGADKARMNRVEVIASGRKIDLHMARGCEAQVPNRALARAGASLSSLLLHGVLVVRCMDDHAQCLQSTRDEHDVLCTIVPRRAK